MVHLKYKLKYTGTLKLLSGLHIGASKENAQIGGVDHPVVRRKDNDQPYIPGSSIKGKIRCLLEQQKGVDIGGDIEINNLFGYSDTNTISKIIVRDAYLTEESALSLKENRNTDLPYSEVKFENTIDRFAGNAGNPRQIERVPAGAEFDVEFVINVWSNDSGNDDSEKLKNLLKKGIDLLNADYLGGNGTRGYGHIKLELDEPEEIGKINNKS